MPTIRRANSSHRTRNAQIKDKEGQVITHQLDEQRETRKEVERNRWDRNQRYRSVAYNPYRAAFNYNKEMDYNNKLKTSRSALCTQLFCEKTSCGTASIIFPSTQHIGCIIQDRIHSTAFTDHMPSDNHKIVIKPIRHFNAQRIDEVAIVIVLYHNIVLYRCNNQLQRVSETHQTYDALQYHILFWQGEDGYHCLMKMINTIAG